jgi:hypothetical protein
MICFVSSVLSLAFWLIGLRTGCCSEVFRRSRGGDRPRRRPVGGRRVLAVACGPDESIKTAALAAGAVYGLRVFQDYVLNPRVLGHAVGLTPLVVLVGVSAVGLLFRRRLRSAGHALHRLLIATLVDVIVRGRDPAKEPVPSVIFPAQETETAGRG